MLYTFNISKIRQFVYILLPTNCFVSMKIKHFYMEIYLFEFYNLVINTQRRVGVFLKFFSMEVLKSQKGLSLIEVVVSSVIISILLISFISFFLHTTKTTNSSDKIIHATYTAQTEMEHIYSYTNKSYNELEGFLIQDGYERIEAKVRAADRLR